MNKNNILKFFTLASLLPCLLASLACSARLPEPKTAQHLVERYFHKYGHKFKTSDFGQHKIDEVKIFDLQEVHKHLVATTAEIKLREGPIYTIRCMLEKKSLGWHLVSWEKL